MRWRKEKPTATTKPAIPAIAALKTTRRGIGVRLGTAAITTRGLDEGDMANLAGWIADVLRSPEDEATIDRVRGAVGEVAKRRPIYS